MTRGLGDLGTGGVLFTLMLAAATSAPAQSCGSSTNCNLIQEAAEMLQPRLGIATSGGNPVAGASSTLGMRIGSIPRVTVGARVTGARLNLPPIRLDDPGEDVTGFPTSLNLDAAVGLFTGFRLVPTIGGFGSIDLVGSVGTLRLSEEDGFQSDPGSWAIGARLGLLRESFTAPGVSVTALYRRIGDVEWQAPFDDTVDPFASANFELTDNSVLSVRAIVGKRLFVLGAAAGIGYDKYTSTMAGLYTCVTCGAPATFTVDEHESDRKTIFGNVSWTLLILNLVAEGGWQSGGERFSAPLPAGQSSKSQKGTAYGSLAIRLVL